MNGTVYLIDDEESMRVSVSQFLSLADLQVQSFADATSALALIDTAFDGVIVSDIRMPGIDGLEFLKKIVEKDSDIPVVLITAHGDIRMAVSAIRDGAYDFLEKPFDPEILLKTVTRALEKRQLLLENRQLRKQLENQPAIDNKLLGNSEVMQSLQRDIHDLGPTDASVFLVGETGSGKEVVARCLHETSSRKRGHFVAINCGAIPEALFESELFGHEAGAFTGAHARQIGKFERADGGTLFLDEITSMPPNLQVKVLRALQEREIERLGGNGPIGIDIRLISATNRDPRQACRDGLFREDLFYRLNLAEITLPPLHQRGSDILLLFEYFGLRAAEHYKRNFPPLSGNSTSLLLSYQWPGNVRELKNCAERYVLSSQPASSRISFILQHSDNQTVTANRPSLAEQTGHFEKCVLQQSLRNNEGNIQAVLEELDLPRRTLNQKMQNHNLVRKDFLREKN